MEILNNVQGADVGQKKDLGKGGRGRQGGKEEWREAKRGGREGGKKAGKKGKISKEQREGCDLKDFIFGNESVMKRR